MQLLARSILQARKLGLGEAFDLILHKEQGSQKQTQRLSFTGPTLNLLVTSELHEYELKHTIREGNRMSSVCSIHAKGSPASTFNLIQLKKKKSNSRGDWVAQSVKPRTLGSCSGPDLMGSWSHGILRSRPTVRVHAQQGVCSLPLPQLVQACSLCLSNK